VFTSRDDFPQQMLRVSPIAPLRECRMRAGLAACVAV